MRAISFRLATLTAQFSVSEAKAKRQLFFGSAKMRMAERIETKLAGAFAPSLLEVTDESEAHRGHAGWREGGETHFFVRLEAAGFAGQSRIARHRAVHRVLAEELAGGLHALRLEIGVPEG